VFDNGRGILNHFRHPDTKHSIFLVTQKELVVSLYDSGYSIGRIAKHDDVIFSHTWVHARIKEVYSHGEIKEREHKHRVESNCMKTPEMRKLFSKLATEQFKDSHQREIRSAVAKRLWQTPEWRNTVMSPEMMAVRAKQAYINNPKLIEDHRDRMIQNRGLQAGKISSIEIKMKNELYRRGIDFIHQFKYKLGIADFMISPNIIVECDGDYWHNIDKVKVRDARQRKYLESSGYKVLSFWEHEINQNIHKCVDSIDQNLRRELIGRK
jgi:very-short-patch-repair endonuclease